MKKIKQTVSRFIKLLYKILPFFIGIYCYYPIFVTQENHLYPLLDTIYSSIRLYSGIVESGIPVGGLLQFARYLALFATFSIVVDLMDRINDVANWFKLFHPRSTVVYGDSAFAEYVYGSMDPKQRIRGSEKFIRRASRYIIMFRDDRENLAFYNRYCAYLKDESVYLMLEDISRQNIENPLIKVFSIAENCARQYWRDHPVSGNERIAIIGFENIGKNILLYGLQVNLIDPGQHFEYHIYGDGTQFRREHTQMDKMAPDEVIFHDDGVYEYADMLNFDRIILCGGQDADSNIPAASRLLAAAPVNCPVYIYAPNGDLVAGLFGQDRLICFGLVQETACADLIFNERSMEDARRQHESFLRQYGGEAWEKLDCFKRYSNVSSSDYMVTIRRLLQQGVPLDTIAELEHIRWCRYHYIHNWKYGPVTDRSRRVHNCLLPFSQLSEEEKLKDVEAVRSKI